MMWEFGVPAIVLLIAGLAGQGFELRRLRKAAGPDSEPAALFADRRNLKWYIMIGTGMILWYAAERGVPISI